MATPAPATWQPIGETVAEFRSECGDFEHLVQSLFDQLDQLRAELDRKMREVERERQRVADREHQLAEQRQETNRFAHQFEHQEARLSETLSELEELKGLVRRVLDEGSERDAMLDSQIENQMETLRREKQTLEREVAAARKENADLRAALARGEGGAVAMLPEDAEHVSELEQERAALEAELELVRGRAAELYDSLSQERRTLAEHRSETANELKQLRRIVERQSELLSERVAAAPAASQRTVTVADVDDEPLDGKPSSDPVINSVMAQFAKLQKEVAERRKHRK